MEPEAVWDRPASRAPSSVRWYEFSLLATAVFLLLFAFYYPHLKLPPCPDLARGLWLEAAFLADTQFDYEMLSTEEPGLDKGGARNYLITILPAILASLMLTFDHPDDVMLTYRVICIVATAIIFVVVYATIRRRRNRLDSLLFSTLVVTTPLFLAQVGQLGFEIPLALASAFTIFALSRGWHFIALLGALAAASIKPTGALVVAAFVVAQCWRTLGWSKLPAWLRHLGPIVGTMIVVAALVISIIAPLQTSQPANEQFGFHSMAVTTPGVLFWLLVAAAGLLVTTFQKIRGNSETNSQDSSTYPSIVVVYAMAQLLLLGAFFELIAYIPRYFAMCVPSLFVIIASLSRSNVTDRLLRTFAVLMIAFNLVNHEGRLLPSLESLDKANGLVDAYSERSTEWIADHTRDVEILRETCAAAPDAFLVGPYGTGPYLATPRMGIVSEGREGAAVLFYSRYYSNIAPFNLEHPTHAAVPSSRNVVVFGYLVNEKQIDSPLPFERGDEFISRRENDRLVSFIKRWEYSPRGPSEWRNWIAARTGMEKDPFKALHERMRAFYLYGGEKRAMAETRDLFRLPLSNEYCLTGVMAAVEFGDLDAAGRILADATRAMPKEPRLRAMQGILELRRGKTESALEAFRSATPLSKLGPYSLYHYGLALFRSGDLSHAQQMLERSIAAQKYHDDLRIVAESDALLASIEWLAGDKQSAAKHWLDAIGLGSPTALEQLSLFKNYHVERDILDAQGRIDDLLTGKREPHDVPWLAQSMPRYQ